MYRAIAKGQDNIRGSLLEGERVELIVIEHYTATRTIVMTDRRALVMRKSGRVLERALTRNDIRGVELRLSPGTSYVVISGPGTVVRSTTSASRRRCAAGSTRSWHRRVRSRCSTRTTTSAC